MADAQDDLHRIDIEDLETQLIAEIDEDVAGFTFWTCDASPLDVDDTTRHPAALQAAHHADAGRGCVLFVGSGSDGRVHWFDGETPSSVVSAYREATNDSLPSTKGM